MKIAIDIRPLKNQSATRGIGMYTSHLVKHLKLSEEVEVVEFSAKQNNVKEGSAKQNEDVDVLHYPFFDLFYLTLPRWRSLPTIVTVHDVTPLVLADLYPTGLKGRLKFEIQKSVLRGVEMVVTDSECSRRDIIKYLGVRPERIKIVYLAPQEGLVKTRDLISLQEVRDKYNLPEEFVLYVGDVNMNKNILSLVEACRGVGIDLVIVGKQAAMDVTGVSKNSEGGFSRNRSSPARNGIHPELRDLVKLQKEYGDHPFVHRVGYVLTAELGAFFQLATVYCQPSLYEGFGVPVLEAMSCGCPVVASKRGSLPEIGGEAAIYVEPTVERIAKGLKLVMNLSPAQRKRLIHEGQKQAAKFSWEKTAKEMVGVYREVIGS